MKLNTIQIAPLLVIFVINCGNFNSIHRDLKVDDGKGALVDIKQRAIIVSEKTVGFGTSAVRQTVVCTEPSPDALSAYAAELAAEADVPEVVTARLVSAFQESTSFTGLRTQSIQLLRDSLYRICEGYMNGALDELQYDILMRRYQKYMVALLAIEQLTGTVRSPAVTISTEGTAQAAKSISEMRSEIESIDAQIAELEDQKKAAAPEDKAEFDEKINEKLADKAAITKGIENAQGLLAEGSATANVDMTGIQIDRSDEHLQAISSVVNEIVMEIINTEDTGQLCFAYLRDDNSNSPALTKACQGYIAVIIEKGNLRNQALDNLIKADAIKSANDIKTAFQGGRGTQ